MLAVRGIIQKGELVQFKAQVVERVAPAPLRNADVDFVFQRDHMQHEGYPRVSNCINFFYAKQCQSCGDHAAIRDLGKE